MNCKPGDLAVITQDQYFNDVDVGKLVEIVGPDEFDGEGRFCWACKSLCGDLAWLVDEGCDEGCNEYCIPDAWLRPIRDQPGADETLTWKEVPAPESVVDARAMIARAAG